MGPSTEPLRGGAEVRLFLTLGRGGEGRQKTGQRSLESHTKRKRPWTEQTLDLSEERVSKLVTVSREGRRGAHQSCWGEDGSSEWERN